MTSLLSIGACALLAANLAFGEEFLTRDEALALAFPPPAKIVRREVVLDESDRTSLEPKLRRPHSADRVAYYEGFDAAGASLGVAAIEDVLGKSEPITYMLSVDGAGKVRSVEILCYRESHGGEIRRAAFRKQFEGKGLDAPLSLRDDVRNIAGATISCRALTDAVHDELLLLDRAKHHTSSAAPVAPPTAAPSSAATVSRTRLAMGTTLEIRVCREGAADPNAAIDAAFAEVERLEALLSDYRESSEVTRLSQAPLDHWNSITPDVLEVLTRARTVNLGSEGAFDPYCGALVDLWREAARRGVRPSASALASARAAGGDAAFELDGARSRLRRIRDGARIDLGGIGKGLALDHAARELERLGAKRALLDFGGQILALDPPLGQRAWKVTLSDPRDRALSLCELALTRSSVSSSADSERELLVGTERVSHIVDPRSGEPARTCLGVATVCECAADADAWSTALFVLGPERGLALAESKSIAATWMKLDGSRVSSSAFRARVGDEVEARR